MESGDRSCVRLIALGVVVGKQRQSRLVHNKRIFTEAWFCKDSTECVRLRYVSDEENLFVRAMERE